MTVLLLGCLYLVTNHETMYTFPNHQTLFRTLSDREYHFRCYKRHEYIFLDMNNEYTLIPNDVVIYQSRYYIRMVARDDDICLGMNISESCCTHIHVESNTCIKSII